MIIEDDGEMRSLLEEFFNKEGFDTDSASNGPEGLLKVSEDHFNIVITDIRMPGPTGLDILPTLRRLKPMIPVVVITAYGSDDLRQRSFERGAAAYIEKPIRLSQLRTLIGELILGRQVEKTWSNAKS